MLLLLDDHAAYLEIGVDHRDVQRSPSPFARTSKQIGHVIVKAIKIGFGSHDSPFLQEAAVLRKAKLGEPPNHITKHLFVL